MEHVGFVGLGIMGRPMALNLAKGGCRLLVNDQNPAAVRALADAGAAGASLHEIGARCKIVFLALPTEAASRQVLFGEDGLAGSLEKGSLVVDMSSVTPVLSAECEKRLAERGVGFLDAPVSGGEPKAADGTLSIMAGGTPEWFERAAPYFALMGSSWVLVGGVGSGSVTKLANQVIVNLTIAAVSEAFVLAAKAGADPLKVYEAIRGGLAGSAVLDAKLPMMAARNFKPGGPISINLKDIRHVMGTAQELDVPLPFTAQLLEVMQALKVAGRLGDDHAGIVQYFERLAGVRVCAEGGDRA